MERIVALTRSFVEEAFHPFEPQLVNLHFGDADLANRIGDANDSGLTRISLETRTLLVEDFLAGCGAPNVDGRARWMSPGLFRRLSDGTLLAELLGIDRLVPFQGPWPESIREGIRTDG